MQLSMKQKIFSQLFVAFLKPRLNFEHFEKTMNLAAFVFPKLRSLKLWLDKCLKSPLSEDPSTSNMVNVRNHFSSLHHMVFIIFIDPCQEN